MVGTVELLTCAARLAEPTPASRPTGRLQHTLRFMALATPAVHGEQAPPGSDKVAARHAAAPAAEPPPSTTAELHLAAADGDETLVRELLAAGADLELADSNGERPLHAAASSGQAGCLRLLLQAGADTEAADAHGHTAVHWAAAAGQEGCLRVLIEHGAQLERRDRNGLTPLALAAGKNQLVRAGRRWAAAFPAGMSAAYC